MKGSESVHKCVDCASSRAIRQFAQAEFEALARKAVFRLQRVKASGIYGGDFRHRTLWDEYCHEAQEGPHDLLEGAWSSTLDPVLAAVVASIPPHQAALLTIDARWEFSEVDSVPGKDVAVAPDLLCRGVEQALQRLAAARDLSRFEPTDDR